MTSYKRNKQLVDIPGGICGVACPTAPLYQYPEGHPCYRCPYTLNASIPSCMFPARPNGGCFRHAQGRQLNQAKLSRQTEQRIRDFIRVLEAVIKHPNPKRRKEDE